MNNNQANYITLYEPWVVETLKTVIGQSVVVETVRGNLQGILSDVKPDHIVIESFGGDALFFVRLQQIVHIMPD